MLLSLCDSNKIKRNLRRVAIMAIQRHIIKAAIYLKDFVSTDVAHIEDQNEVLKNLLEQAKDTQFEKFYKFKAISKIDDWDERVECITKKSKRLEYGI